MWTTQQYCTYPCSIPWCQTRLFAGGSPSVVIHSSGTYFADVLAAQQYLVHAAEHAQHQQSWLHTSGRKVSGSRRLASALTILLHFPLLLFLLCSFSNVLEKHVFEKAPHVGPLLWGVADAQLDELPQLCILYGFETFRQASLHSTSGLSPRCPGGHRTLQCGWIVDRPG